MIEGHEVVPGRTDLMPFGVSGDKRSQETNPWTAKEFHEVGRTEER